MDHQIMHSIHEMDCTNQQIENNALWYQHACFSRNSYSSFKQVYREK